MSISAENIAPANDYNEAEVIKTENHDAIVRVVEEYGSMSPEELDKESELSENDIKNYRTYFETLSLFKEGKLDAQNSLLFEKSLKEVGRELEQVTPHITDQKGNEVFGDTVSDIKDISKEDAEKQADIIVENGQRDVDLLAKATPEQKQQVKNIISRQAKKYINNISN